MLLFLKACVIWMPVKINMPCLFCNATWKDISYGHIDSIGNTKELQIWVALVQNKLNMRKIKPWNFWICVNTCDSVSDFTVPVNMGIEHVLSLDATSSVWSVYILSKDFRSATQNGFQFLKVLQDATGFGEGWKDRDISENYSQVWWVVNCFWVFMYVH